MKRFVILAVPRTGSNLLCTLLNSHPEILCHHEVFNPQGIFLALTQRDRPHSLPSLDERNRDPLRFLDEVWATGEGFRCVGFKWTRGQSTIVLDHVSREVETTKIVLRRRNRVKTYVSAEIAQLTRQWEVYHQQELVQPRPRVVIDEAKLVQHIRENERYYSDLIGVLDTSHQPWMELVYEDLFENNVQQQLLQFLQVAPQKLDAASVKQNPTDLRESIANFSELSRRLAGSDLEAELHELE